MPSLQAIYEKYLPTHNVEHHGDKGTSHSYIDAYESLLLPYREVSNLRLLEVGVAEGLSLQMWRDYFSDGATIIGCDISDSWLSPETANAFDIIIGNSKVPSTRKAIERFAPFDIIIDDGDHNPWAQLLTYYSLFPLLRSGGMYVIEDIANLDSWEHEFRSLQPNVEVFDLRKLKNRQDDSLIVLRRPAVEESATAWAGLSR